MQTVEGSSPFIRSSERPGKPGLSRSRRLSAASSSSLSASERWVERAA